MTFLLGALSKHIITKPDIIQFTKDRKYEEAWIIPFSSPHPTVEEIKTYLKDTFTTIIVEYIWNSKDDKNRFVITIFLDTKCRLQDPFQFIQFSLDNLYHYKNFNSLVQNFDTSVIGHEYLLRNKIDSINISVFNHWLSVGPEELWKKGQEYNIDEIKTKIQKRKEIERTKLNYQGLLFRFNVNGTYSGPYYGIKTPCCQKIGEEWVVDFGLIDYWMGTMLSV